MARPMGYYRDADLVYIWDCSPEGALLWRGAINLDPAQREQMLLDIRAALVNAGADAGVIAPGLVVSRIADPACDLAQDSFELHPALHHNPILTTPGFDPSMN